MDAGDPVDAITTLRGACERWTSADWTVADSRLLSNPLWPFKDCTPCAPKLGQPMPKAPIWNERCDSAPPTAVCGQMTISQPLGEFNTENPIDNLVVSGWPTSSGGLQISYMQQAGGTYQATALDIDEGVLNIMRIFPPRDWADPSASGCVLGNPAIGHGQWIVPAAYVTCLSGNGQCDDDGPLIWSTLGSSSFLGVAIPPTTGFRGLSVGQDGWASKTELGSLTKPLSYGVPTGTNRRGSWVGPNLVTNRYTSASQFKKADLDLEATDGAVTPLTTAPTDVVAAASDGTDLVWLQAPTSLMTSGFATSASDLKPRLLRVNVDVGASLIVGCGYTAFDGPSASIVRLSDGARWNLPATWRPVAITCKELVAQTQARAVPLGYEVSVGRLRLDSLGSPQ